MGERALADEVVEQAEQPDRPDRPGAKAAAANALMNERLRSNPPPLIGTLTGGIGSPPAADGKDRGAPAAARTDGEASSRPPSEEGQKPTRSAQSEAAAGDDPWRKYVNERHGGDEEKAKRAVYETDTRAAQLARENAELKAGRDGKPPDSASTETPTPTAAEYTEQRFNQELAAAQQEFIGDDQECGRLIDQYKESEPKALAYGTPTEDGHYVGGSVEQIQQELVLAQRNLERGRVGGHELDEVEKSELRDEIRGLKDNLRDEKDAATVAWRRVQNLTVKWDRRVEAFQRSYSKDWSERAQAEVRGRAAAKAAGEAEQTWDTSFKTLKEGLTAEEADELETDLLLRASAHTRDGGDVPGGDLAAWMAKEGGRLRSRYAQRAGETDRQRTQQTLQSSRRPTPGGEAIVAPEAALQGTARERRRAADLRTSQLLRSATSGR